MARLESMAKMGYYPTPPSVVERIKTFIKIQEQTIMLDPCCGEGNA